MAAGGRPVAASFIDRLTLNSAARLQPSPSRCAKLLNCKIPSAPSSPNGSRPNGLHIERVRTPLGVIGVIYESRPNVTADAGALCLKAGNAVILRGGSDSANSFAPIHACLVKGLDCGRPARRCDPARADHRSRRRRCASFRARRIGRRDRSAWRQKPRCARPAGSRVPVFAHLEGHLPCLCRPARPISTWRRRSSSTPRCGAPAICGAAETLLVDSAAVVHPSAAADRGADGGRLRSPRRRPTVLTASFQRLKAADRRRLARPNISTRSSP